MKDKHINIIAIIGFVIYVCGAIYFNGQVSESCTHGNCKHGWFSKYNTQEKAVALLWIVGIPGTLLLIYIIQASSKKRNPNRFPTRKYSKSNKIASHSYNNRQAMSISLIDQAISNSKSISFDYKDKNGDKSFRTIDPTFYEHIGHTLCIHGWCHLRKENRTFALKRMQNVVVTDRDELSS